MANLLTGLRLLLIVPVSWGLALPGTFNPWLVLLLLLLAILTDILDGKLARALGTASARGMLFDHATDFLFVTCGLAGLALQGSVPAVLPVLIVVAFSQYVFDSYVLLQQKQLRMSPIGRWNGILYFVPLVSMAVAALDVSPDTSRNVQPALRNLLQTMTFWIGWGLVVSTIASIVDRAIAPLRHP